MDENQCLQRGDALAQQCAGRVHANQLSQVLAHLKRHRSPEATRALVSELPASAFAGRTRSTREQFQALKQHVTPILASRVSWQEAAQVLGWAIRLMKWYEVER